ncbi:MAG: hypothetical protein ACO2PN_06705 [Pyrobaculum sp.]
MPITGMFCLPEAFCSRSESAVVYVDPPVGHRLHAPQKVVGEVYRHQVDAPQRRRHAPVWKHLGLEVETRRAVRLVDKYEDGTISPEGGGQVLLGLDVCELQLAYLQRRREGGQQ